MATIPCQLIASGDGFRVYKWENLNNTDQDGQPFEVGKFADISFHVKGTFGGATITIQGDNDAIGTPDWDTLNDSQGNALIFTSRRIEQLLENVSKIRPLLSGGAGSSVNVFMKVRS
jgi:hypothetical protein